MKLEKLNIRHDNAIDKSNLPDVLFFIGY